MDWRTKEREAEGSPPAGGNQRGDNTRQLDPNGHVVFEMKAKALGDQAPHIELMDASSPWPLKRIPHIEIRRALGPGRVRSPA